MKKKVVAIIQARMASTRLPGKVMLNLGDKPMIWHVLENVKKIKSVDEIVVATTKNKEDDKLVDYLKSIGVSYFRGSEHNVLDRFIKAGEKFGADITIRVCSDVPFIDPKSIDDQIKIIKKSKAEYVTAKQGIKCILQGVGVVTLDALKKQLEYSHEDYVKEHVTIYMFENPEKFKVAYFIPEKIFQIERFRLSVDTLADLKFMQEIYKRLYSDGKIVKLKEVIELLNKHPELKEINEHVKQKKPKKKHNRILIKTEADKNIGLGHLKRALILAKYFVEYLNQGVIMGINSPCQKLIGEENSSLKYEIIDTAEKIIAFSNKRHIDIIIVDVKDTDSYNFQEIKKNTKIKKIVLVGKLTDDSAVDLCVIPSIPTKIEKKWSKKANVLLGLDALFLDESFDKAKKARKNNNDITVTISCGGADPYNLTRKVIELLSLIDLRKNYKFQIILGPFYKNKGFLLSLLESAKFDYELVFNPKNVAECFAKSDIAIITHGTSFYQFAYLGILTLNLVIHKKDIKLAKKIEKLGLGRYIGFKDAIDKKKLFEGIQNIKRLNIDLKNNIGKVCAEILR